MHQGCATLVFYANMDWFVRGKLNNINTGAFGAELYAREGFACNDYSQVCIWLQISLSAELLIFSTRSRGLFFMSRPSLAHLCSTMLGGCLLSSLLAAYVFSAGGKVDQSHRGIHWDDIGIIWAYDLVCLLIIDYVKLLCMHEFGGFHGPRGILDEARYAREDKEFKDRATKPKEAT